jgi:hypothetical protein
MITTSRRQLLAGPGLLALGGAIPAGWLAIGGGRRCARAGEAEPVHRHRRAWPHLPRRVAAVRHGRSSVPIPNTHGWDACSGYHQKDGSIMGFSHTHLSGTGIGDMLDVLVVPTRRELKLQPGTIEKPGEGYRQRYSDEHAEPGYYRVKLETGVLAELTVTERTGLHRYRFGQGPGTS